MQKKQIIISVVLVASVLLAAALVYGNRESAQKMDAGMSDTPGQMTEAPSGSELSEAVVTNAIAIDDYAFGPAVIRVKAGDTVTWTNNDSVRHNVVADERSAAAPEGPLIADGKSYSFTFTKAGTYPYHCEPHPNMKGTVVVTD